MLILLRRCNSPKQCVNDTAGNGLFRAKGVRRVRMVGQKTWHPGAQGEARFYLPELHYPGLTAYYLPDYGLHSRQQGVLQAPSTPIDHLGSLIRSESFPFFGMACLTESAIFGRTQNLL